ncbi:hypothetical protein BpHYR1_024044 [Brachionus plicatilis]|uniref:RNA-directed DNA polymerase from mobile element jockey-like n=1 Tax=Brachionus plicatilis TaxID=10195 RepID=A0A3M7SIP4_BRAPC|nr:hypothetical protein BpHYR1_024044 [Brachionus plicatilis]
MSVTKCNCIVFSRTSKGNNSLNLFMNNQQVPQAKEILNWIDYRLFFFVLSTISKASISKIQATQNRAIRSIYDLHFDPIKRTYPSIIDAKSKSAITHNQLIQQLVYEYIECTSMINLTLIVSHNYYPFLTSFKQLFISSTEKL